MKTFYTLAAAFFYVLLAAVNGLSLYAGNPVKVVVIDAGHGGKDPGAIGVSGAKEKDITLALALKLGALIEKNKDVKVVYTRKTDVFVELYRRAQIANNHHADWFISIHCNAADNNTASGVETFVMGVSKSDANLAIAQKENASILKESDYESNYGGFVDPNSPEAYIIFALYQNKYLDQSIRLAAAVQSELKTICKRQDRGVKEASFLVLWRSAMPSILVEVGFLSHKEEELYLISEKGQNELALAMYNGFSKVSHLEQLKMPDLSNVIHTEPPQTDTKTTVSPKNEENPTVKPSPKTENTEIKTITVETSSPPKSISASAVVYKVQMMAGNKKMEKTDPAFKNIPNIETEQIGNVYRYMHGNCSTFAEAQDLLTKTKAKGFSDAFIVAYKNGTRITLQEAKELEDRK